VEANLLSDEAKQAMLKRIVARVSNVQVAEGVSWVTPLAKMY
jgi:hypothetical protein